MQNAVRYIADVPPVDGWANNLPPINSFSQNNIENELLLFLFGALALTILIELAVFALFGYRTKKALITVALANLVTVPVLHVVLFLFAGTLAGWGGPFLDEEDFLIFAEIGVFVIETIAFTLILKEKLSKMAFVTFVANETSVMIGLVVFYLFDFF